MKDPLKEQIDTCLSELIEIERRINELAPTDKMKLYLTKYALIRTCGTIEHVYRAIVADFFDQFTVPQMHTYLAKTVRESSSSAKYDNMCDLLGKFDGTWKDAFKNAVSMAADGEQLKSSVSSLVTNRHLFAHGRPPTATFLDIKGYYSNAIKLITLFDSVVA